MKSFSPKPSRRCAHFNPQLQRKAILSYLREGYGLGLVSEELVDYFCVSTPNVVEEAGYHETDGDAVVAMFDELHDQFRKNELK